MKPFSVVLGVLTLALAGTAVPGRAADRTQLTGAWTLNTDLSDKPAGGADGAEGGRRGGGGRGYGGGRGGGRGGYGGGMRGGGGGGGREGRGNSEDMARTREALAGILTPAPHLTITQTDTMVVITDGDGRTTRLAPNGEKIKEENTNLTRKTTWQNADLVSQITGLTPGTITETYSVDQEHHQLRITVRIERGKDQQQNAVMHRIYDADPR